ncbi:MAG: futalosine hydrolase [Prevotellaceae bacterium]|jgi:futalosine hydrolase|nr:futalosine hydrolase [Prevotellaceae bacterium]
MKILVTAATDGELRHIVENDAVTRLTTGIGIVATAYSLGKIQLQKYNLVLNVGIAGSFSTKLKIGDVAVVESEAFGDFGILSDKGFTSCFDEGLLAPNSPPFSHGLLFSENAAKIAEQLSLPTVKGLTNNAVSGEKNRIRFMREKFSADIETMESAAFFYVLLSENMNFAAFRAISNMVEPRNKNNWNIPLAVKNLSNRVNTYINSILC